MPDFTSYLPPDVYVEEAVSPLVSVIGINPTVVALVGPSVGYRVHTEVVVLNGTEVVELEKRGIITATGFRVTDAAGVVYSSAGYTLTVGGGGDVDLATLNDNTTTIQRVVPAAPALPVIPDGATVYITYRYADPDYFAPFRAYDYDDVRAAFGEAVDPVTTEVRSPLSLAAKIAFENGSSELVCVSTRTPLVATRAELTEAYTKLDAEYDVNVVVPLPVGITGTLLTPGDVLNVGTDLRSYIHTSRSNRLLRVGILGYDSAVTYPPDEAVTSFRSERVVLAWPNRMEYFVGTANRVIEIDGYYLAAAYAGRIASLPVQMPLTKKQVVGFSGIPAPVLAAMTPSYKNKLSDAGVAVTEKTRDQRLIVRHGTTTRRDTILTRELSLIRARDALINLLQDTVDRNELVGIPIDLQTPTRVKGVIAGVLEAAKDNQVIIDYANLKARQLSIDPTVIEVKFEYIPAYPLNYVVISFTVATSTGDINLLDNQAVA